MKYKIGDKVRIRKDLKTLEVYGDQLFVKQMEKYKGTPVTISEVFSGGYYIKEDKDENKNWSWTDEMFEGLVDDELTAEEAIRLRLEMCNEMQTLCKNCGMSKHNNNMGVSCNELQQKYPERAVKILKQWKVDHEKKEIESEFAYLIRVMKEEGDSTTCIYTYEVKEDKDDINEKMNELVKKYYEENGGKIYAKCERICRVKS